MIRLNGMFLDQQKLVLSGFKETDERISALIRMQEDTWKMIRNGDRKFDKLSEKLDRVADVLEGFLKGPEKPNGSQ